MKENLIFKYGIPERGEFGFYSEVVETGKDQSVVIGYFLREEGKEDKIYLVAQVAFEILAHTLQGTSYVPSLSINPNVIFK